MVMYKYFYVYILCSRRNGTLYIGVTNDLIRRVYQHKGKFVQGFTKQYDVDKLVYYTCFDTAEAAILYEKKLKKWNRKWKLDLIEQMNPEWKDLYDEL